MDSPRQINAPWLKTNENARTKIVMIFDELIANSFHRKRQLCAVENNPWCHAHSSVANLLQKVDKVELKRRTASEFSCTTYFGMSRN